MSNQTKRQNAIKFLILFETSANIREKELYMIMFLDTCQSIIDKKLINLYSFKSVQLRSYFWFVFSCIRFNTAKNGPEITLYLDNFHAV